MALTYSSLSILTNILYLCEKIKYIFFKFLIYLKHNFMNKILFSLFFTTILFSSSAFSATILSIQSGEWNNPSTWQGGTIPTGNDDVTIALGTTLTVSQTGGDYVAVCKSLTINGSFTYLSNRIVIGSSDPFGIPSSGGNAALTVNGTLAIEGGYANSFYHNGYVVFNTGSTFRMTAGFMHVNGNTGNPLSSVPAGTALIDCTNATTFSATGGTLFITNPHIDAATTCIKGQKSFTENSAVSFGAYVAPVSSNNYFVDAATAPTFQSIELNYISNTTRLEMTDIDIKGAVNVNSGILYNPHLIKTVRIGRDVNIGNNGRIIGRIEMNGLTQQNINPNTFNGAPITGAVIEGDIISNNVMRVKIKLDLEILGDLILQQGKFDVNNKTLTLRRSPMTPSTTAYVVTYDLYQQIGTLKIKNVTTNTIFPIGTEQSYAPVFITALGGDFSASVHPPVLSVPSEFAKVNLEWDISRVSGAYDADVLIQWNTTDESSVFTSNRAQCNIYHYDGTNWATAATTTGPTTSWGTYFTKLAVGIKSFSTFSIFTSSVVPVTLTQFKGQVKNEDAYLTWETATEFNNAGFDIEKSTDGIQFSNIGFVKGQGSSFNANTYSFVDKHFLQTAYYRLKQLDFDGKVTYSSIVALQKTGEGSALKMYPNPISTQSFLTIDFPKTMETRLDIAIFDVQGRKLYQNQTDKNIETLNIPVSDLARGMYFIHIFDGTKQTISKFVKN